MVCFGISRLSSLLMECSCMAPQNTGCDSDEGVRFPPLILYVVN